MPSRLHLFGTTAAVVLTALWAGFLFAIVGFGKGMGGTSPSQSDYIDVLLWLGSLGFAVTLAMGFAAWRNRSGAWIAVGTTAVMLVFAAWLFV